MVPNVSERGRIANLLSSGGDYEGRGDRRTSHWRPRPTSDNIYTPPVTWRWWEERE
ncbi:hypothetical protein TIFTF001_035856 [Ficus carica]|uniref:Uncharacterized protein n=1 Tax=Ficus carica TaxID=3494 RepID=A0AA88E386_FICCA|nr:hypothetical protein TIFTF001_035856 [Ficus carica]